MTIHGTIFPRTQLDLFAKRDTAEKPAVYLLLGSDVNSPEEIMLYIGEGDPVLPRLKHHLNNKDFWSEAIVFSSKDEYLTKTQIKYLEAAIFSLAKQAYRAKLDNNQIPTKPNISEVDKAEMEQFLESIKLILSALGIDLLEPRTTQATDSIDINRIFELSNKGALARMAIIDNKYVVLRGSTSVFENRQSITPAIVKLRKDLVDAGIMIRHEKGLYKFVEDATFNSPSYAAAAIVGGAANGRTVWKIDGK
jgi:hypothetical protein